MGIIRWLERLKYSNGQVNLPRFEPSLTDFVLEYLPMGNSKYMSPVTLLVIHLH